MYLKKINNGFSLFETLLYCNLIGYRQANVYALPCIRYATRWELLSPLVRTWYV